MTGAKRGRPRKPQTDPADLEVLTIPEALTYIRSIGRGISRPKLLDAILSGRLPARIDELRHDRFGHPLLSVTRVDLQEWLASTIKPFVVPQVGNVRRFA